LAQTEAIFESTPDDKKTVDMYYSLMELYAKSLNLKRVRELQNAVKKLEATPRKEIIPSLIYMYSSLNSMSHAHSLYNRIAPHESCANMLIKGYFSAGDFQKGLALFDDMIRTSIKPSSYTFTSMIDGYGKAGEINKAEDVFYNWLPKYSVPPSNILVTALLSSTHKKDEIMQIFHKIPQRYRHTDAYATVINVLFENRDVSAVEGLLSQMKNEGLQVSRNVLTAVVNGYSSLGQYSDAETYFLQAVDDGVQVSNQALNTLILGMCKQGRTDNAYSAFVVAENKNIVMYGTMISGFMHNNQIDQAERLFESMLKLFYPNTVVFNTMIKGYCKAKLNEKAVQIYEQMKRMKIPSDEITLMTIAVAFKELGRDDEANACKKQAQKMNSKTRKISKRKREVLT
jgi:pentatricopeptide repeat protein